MRKRRPADARAKILRHYSYSFAAVPKHARMGFFSRAMGGRAGVGSSHRDIEEYYQLGEIIGRGTCGDVMWAVERGTNTKRAVKSIPVKASLRASRSEVLESIKAEVCMLKSLDHPYIVKLVDAFVSPKTVYLVMELLHGGDLFDRITETEFSEMESRRIMRRVFSAVFYLHETMDVVHRDLKLENILLVDRGNKLDIKLTDFGLAKSITEAGLRTVCGTPQ